ncbi:hypothetical protein J7E97_20590 [Streptomyces sp. ISL-66]|uniref:hypothetical protein n=1 Tax=Streptomyces sp. ISL-66 TaxID=2819186 RepID=UPI001BE6F48B|nr:hypothetical protein [Streptomyces sp. ISL-66]MBT2470209.1 hypothetical protein [Streptomyces sp. ISL-66]
MTTSQGVPCHLAPLPASVSRLTHAQALGRACVSCGAPLAAGAVERGTIHGAQGVHVTSTEVWSCPAPEPSSRSSAAVANA